MPTAFIMHLIFDNDEARGSRVFHEPLQGLPCRENFARTVPRSIYFYLKMITRYRHMRYSHPA